MDCEQGSVEEENIRLRRVNKILRIVNGQLRRRLNAEVERSDELFLALCEVEITAEASDE